jgi:TusA-related sulfurtransferase
MDIPPESNGSMHSKTRMDMSVADVELDITHEVCPMTYVRTRLALDRMVSRQTLLVMLRGDEPRRNVARTAAAQGHVLVVEDTDAEGVTRLLLRRA